jgi:drug/metabolite transporter (DMT)-like permease
MAASGVLLLSSFCLFSGFGPYFVKITHGINPAQILFGRAVIASVFLIAFAIFTKRWRELKFRFPIGTIVMGVVEGLSIYFYYLALEKTTIANATLLVYTAPIFSVILSKIFLKEKVEKKTIWGIIASFTGVIIVSDPTKLRIDPGQMYGSIFALLGGFFYSAMAISSKSLTQKTTPLYSAFWQYFIVMVLTAFFVLPTPLQVFTNNAISLLYLGLVAGGFAFLLYMEGLKRVKGQIIQVITMLELIVASLSGFFLLKEPITLNTLLGGAFILLGIFVVSLKKKSY